MTIALSQSGKWIEDVLGTDWSEETKRSGEISLVSRSVSHPERGIHYARVCILDIPGKFFAETLVIYPQTHCVFPVFGSEYIKTGRGHFGATDFHPVDRENNYIPEEFSPFPDRIVEKSPHYNLDTHFSPKLWHRKGPEGFYGEFSDTCEGRLYHYLGVLSTRPRADPLDTEKFHLFDSYMAENDPARGILKAYFDAEFADDYIRGFLFPHC